MTRDAAKPTRRALVGIVLLDKPIGVTSNRILQRTKRLFRAEKAGHTGTLDPMATGMLPICFGAATKVSALMLGSSKRYRVRARFGTATDTGDASGSVVERSELLAPSADELASAVSAMLGESSQVPPMYSAVKHQGKRLYQLAREGREVTREPRSIEIFELLVEEYAAPDLTFQVHCSKGTYVRTLVTDLARKLGTVAHVAELRRLSVEPFDESQMISFDALEAAAAEDPDSVDRWLLAPDAALTDMPAVRVSAQEALALRQGQRIAAPECTTGGLHRIYDPEGIFIGIAASDEFGALKPKRIFPAETLVQPKLFG